MPTYPCSLAVSYQRGRQYLDARQRVCEDGREPLPSGSLTTFSRDRVGALLVEAMAVEMNVPTSELKSDAKFAEAVDTIVSNGGPHAMTVLLHPPKPQTKNAIFKLSRKSAERQRHRIDAVHEGRARSVAPQPTDRVPDTMSFVKINNRLARALGQVVACHRLLDLKPRLSAVVREAVVAKAQELYVVSTQLSTTLKTIEVNFDRNGPTSHSRQRLDPRVTERTLIRQLGSAVGLIEKNVRDLPASSYDLRPTMNEMKVAKHETRRLWAECRTIVRLLGGSGRSS